MVTANNYMFRPLTGHHQVVHTMKRVGGCTVYNVTSVWWHVTLCIVQPPTLFIRCTTWWWPVRGRNM